ncbi:MAG: hypothetical protein IPM60_14680 [Rhodospirillales bacterium]|nr:hypothetical protein [Rhodospirillales bacterium]
MAGRNGRYCSDGCETRFHDAVLRWINRENLRPMAGMSIDDAALAVEDVWSNVHDAVTGTGA